jgi:hypothetical protein
MIPGENRKNFSLLKLVKSKRGEVNLKIYWWKYFDASAYFVLSRREGSNSSQTAFINHYEPMSQFWAILALVSKPASFDEPSLIQSILFLWWGTRKIEHQVSLTATVAHLASLRLECGSREPSYFTPNALETMRCSSRDQWFSTCLLFNFWSSQRPDHFHNAFFFNECPEVN